MFIEDLTVLNPKPRSWAIGWLDATHSFPTGKVGDEVLDKLFKLCASPIIRTRGFHECSFCSKIGKARQFERNGQTVWLGSGQIRLRGQGKTYEAPNLIYHYCADHNYLPPHEFIQAVVRPRNWLQRRMDWLVFNSQ